MYNEENSPNINNNLSIDWALGFTQDSATFSQDQANNNQPIELFDFTNNHPFIEWNTCITQNDENQINNNLSLEWTTCFTQDQPNTSLLNINDEEITQHCEKQINTLQQQYDAKSVKEDKHQVSLASRRRKRCKTCEGCKTPYINTKQRYCRQENYDVVLKNLNDSEKMGSDYLNELKNYIHCRDISDEKRGNKLLHEQKKTERGEIKFPENEDTYVLPSKINDQAIYSSRSLTELIKKALKLSSKACTNCQQKHAKCSGSAMCKRCTLHNLEFTFIESVKKRGPKTDGRASALTLSGCLHQQSVIVDDVTLYSDFYDPEQVYVLCNFENFFDGTSMLCFMITNPVQGHTLTLSLSGYPQLQSDNTDDVTLYSDSYEEKSPMPFSNGYTMENNNFTDNAYNNNIFFLYDDLFPDNNFIPSFHN
ncbi:33353_t:CDS:2 [Gigaspora margarita]|uniref:33353_t:CDS:1 n=1 Tax=Gigaspora margarita TaxID=4874 RepID=A0ABN7UVI7_GIGMA|nr:33353_t:CDS:2 [Gigaspora margarita]